MSAKRRGQEARPKRKRAARKKLTSKREATEGGEKKKSSRSDRDERGRFILGHPGSGGRPKGSKSLSDALRRRLQYGLGSAELELMVENFGLNERQRQLFREMSNRLDVLAELLILRSLGGNVQTLQEIFDRLDPKPKRTEISGPRGGPIRTLAAEIDVTEAEAEEAYRSVFLGEDLGDDE